MEEQILPWWKRALRAAIGTLKSGFGLFARTTPELKAAEQVAEVVIVEDKESSTADPSTALRSAQDDKSLGTVDAQDENSLEEKKVAEIEPTEEIEEVEEKPDAPVVEVEDETVATVIDAPEMEKAIEEVEIAVSEESTTADPSTAHRSAQDDNSLVTVDSQDENSLIGQEFVGTAPEEEIAELEPEQVDEIAVEETDEPAEDVKSEEVIDSHEEPVAESELAKAESEPEEKVEAIEIEAEVVEIEPLMAVEEQEIVHDDRMETLPEVEAETTQPVADEVQIETEAVQPAEEELQITEENVEQKDLLDDQPDAGSAESIPETQNEIEEMKPLHEEDIAEVETINTDTENGEPESVAEAAHETESEPEVSVVEIAVEQAVEMNAESTSAVATPVEIQVVVEPVAAVVAPAEQQPIKHVIKEEDDKSSPFSIIVSQIYEGPMDLLLDLIRKQDIDIYDIPIAKITEQFLTYVERLRASDMDMAGEFIYTASLLIHIKSKTLLPRAPSGQDDYEDPRRELVERLLEHERFKNAAAMLQQKQILEDATWTNPGIREFKGDAGTEPELAADTVDLVRVFREILDRARNRPVINVEEDAVTVGQMIQFLGRRLNMEDRPIALRKLLAHTHSQRALVAMFLALLELVRLQAILLRQDKLFSEIFIKKSDGFDSVMTEGFLAARDDWA